jgi:hypothetical protein
MQDFFVSPPSPQQTQAVFLLQLLCVSHSNDLFVFIILPQRDHSALSNFGSSAKFVGKNDVVNGLMENAASVEIRALCGFPTFPQARLRFRPFEF